MCVSSTPQSVFMFAYGEGAGHCGAWLTIPTKLHNKSLDYRVAHYVLLYQGG